METPISHLYMYYCKNNVANVRFFEQQFQILMTNLNSSCFHFRPIVGKLTSVYFVSYITCTSSDHEVIQSMISHFLLQTGLQQLEP